MSDYLATVEQVGYALNTDLDPNDPTATFWLGVVSEAVRDYTEQQFTLKTGDVEYATFTGGAILPQQYPVITVSQVETMAGDGSWLVQNGSVWRLLPTTGAVIPAGVGFGATAWPTAPDMVRITYTHGYAEIPDGLSGVVAMGAARMFSTPAGVISERVGQRSATYKAGDVFSPLELVILGRYREARMA